MSEPLDRRTFAAMTASVVLGREALSADTPAEVAPMPHTKPTEAPFTRDYPKPGFNPAWRRPQINKLMVQDFVIFAHTDIAMVKKLLDKEPALANAFMDWGGATGRAASAPRRTWATARWLRCSSNAAPGSTSSAPS